MGYETAPATRMVATHCAICARPLLDAESVECGVGPICRTRNPVAAHLTEEARNEANRLVYEIAARQDDCPEVKAALARLEALGCTVLATAIRKRIYGEPIEITVVDGMLAVKSPYHAGAVARMRDVRGRRWDGATKRNLFPLGAFEALLDIFSACYAGLPVKGPSGSGVAGGGEPLTRDVLGIPAAPAKPEAPTVGVRIVRDSVRFAVWAPYDTTFINFARTCDGHFWSGDARAHVFALTTHDDVLGCVRSVWPAAKIVESEGEVPAPPPRRRYRRSHYRGAY